MGDHVFLCYARKDEDFVLKLATNLKGRGVPVWLDQWDIPPSADWDLTASGGWPLAKVSLSTSHSHQESVDHD